MEELDSRLLNAISTALLECEENSDLVITTSIIDEVSQVILKKVKDSLIGKCQLYVAIPLRNLIAYQLNYVVLSIYDKAFKRN